MDQVGPLFAGRVTPLFPADDASYFRPTVFDFIYWLDSRIRAVRRDELRAAAVVCKGGPVSPLSPAPEASGRPSGAAEGRCCENSAVGLPGLWPKRHWPKGACSGVDDRPCMLDRADGGGWHRFMSQVRRSAARPQVVLGRGAICAQGARLGAVCLDRDQPPTGDQLVICASPACRPGHGRTGWTAEGRARGRALPSASTGGIHKGVRKLRRCCTRRRGSKAGPPRGHRPAPRAV